MSGMENNMPDPKFMKPCHELTARTNLRVVGSKHMSIPCSGYER